MNAQKKRRAVSFRGLTPSSAAASKAKRANRKTGSHHEMQLASALRSLGLTFRRNVTRVLGSPDFVFATERVAIFCDGDFWHGRDWRRLRVALSRRHNAEYWIAKIKRNRARDRSVSRQLQVAGWTVLRFWESDIQADVVSVSKRIRACVRGSSSHCIRESGIAARKSSLRSRDSLGKSNDNCVKSTRK